MKSKPKIFVLAIPGVVILILVALLVYVFVSGKIYAGVKDSSQSVAVYNKEPACGQDVVDKYLGIVGSKGGYGTNSFDSLVDEIKTKPRYTDESVCNYIIFQQATLQKDDATIENLKKQFEESLDKPQPLNYAYQIGLSKDSVESLLLMKKIHSKGRGSGIKGNG